MAEYFSTINFIYMTLVSWNAFLTKKFKTAQLQDTQINENVRNFQPLLLLAKDNKWRLKFRQRLLWLQEKQKISR